MFFILFNFNNFHQSHLQIPIYFIIAKSRPKRNRSHPEHSGQLRSVHSINDCPLSAASTPPAPLSSPRSAPSASPRIPRTYAHERAFFDVFLGFVDDFKNPASIVIKGVQNAFGSTWITEVSAQNGYGGNGTTRYWIDKSIGIWDMDDLGLDFEYEADPSYNVDLLNEALKERQ